MNILEYNIDENCEERLRPIFFMKMIAEHKLLKLESNLQKTIIDFILKDLQSNYNTQFYAIFNYIVLKEELIDKNSILDSLKNINIDKINKISETNIFYNQVLRAFKRLTDIELHEIIQDFIIYLSNKEIDYNNVAKILKDKIVNVDDKIIAEIISEQFHYYVSTNQNNKPEDILYMYNSGLVICFSNLLIDNKNYIVKYLDENSIKQVKSLLDTIGITEIKAIYSILEKKEKVIPDYFIEYTNKNSCSLQNMTKYYVWIEKQGIQDRKNNYYLAKFYLEDTLLHNIDKARVLFEDAVENGVNKANIDLCRIYEFKNNYEKALYYAEKAKECCNENVEYLIERYKYELKKLKEVKKDKEKTDSKTLNYYINKYMELTKKKCIQINIKELELTNNPFKSKIGGNPYMPSIEEWPKDENGDYMPLLIQINFEDIKSNEYPNTGILQIFVEKNLRNDPTDYAIKYHRDISKESIKEYPTIDLSEFIISESCSIEFNEAVDYMPMSDYRFDDILESFIKEILEDSKKLEELKNISGNNKDIDESKIKDLIHSMIYKKISTIEVTLGGYADFAQTDPRTDEYEEDLTECLLKIDSDGWYGFNIGDGGKLSLLISKEDLENFKFENAVLHWDSY